MPDLRALLLLCLSFVLLGPNPVHSHPSPGTPSTTSGPDFVYRAEGALLSPSSVAQQGGFLPHGEDGTRPNQPPADTSLFNHIEGALTGTSRHTSGYVSTSTDLNSAIRFLNEVLLGDGYIYRIHVTPNFINATGTLGRYYTHPLEREASALGRIHWSQVAGWTRYRSGRAQGSEETNTSYQAGRFDGQTWGGTQPQLAGFPPGHVAWAQEPWSAFSSCPPSKRHVPRPGKCNPEKSAEAFADEYLKHVPQGCYNVDDWKLEVTLSDSWFSGTSDSVLAIFGNLQFDIFDDPKRGDRARMTPNNINLPSSIHYKPGDTIPIDSFHRVELQQLKPGQDYFNDNIKLGSVRAWIHCVESGQWLWNTEYSNLEKVLETSSNRVTTVWEQSLKPEDWRPVPVKQVAANGKIKDEF